MLLNQIPAAHFEDSLNNDYSHCISLPEQHIFPSGIERENKLMATVCIILVFSKAHQVP